MHPKTPVVLRLRCVFVYDNLRFLPRDQPQQEGQDHCAENGDDDCVDHATLTGKAESPHDEAPDDRAYDTDNDIHDRAIATALHQLAGDPARDETDDDPPDDKHARTPFLYVVT